jgi:hypothetical protein
MRLPPPPSEKVFHPPGRKNLDKTLIEFLGKLGFPDFVMNYDLFWSKL